MNKSEKTTNVSFRCELNQTIPAVVCVTVAIAAAARYIPAVDTALKPLSQYIVVSDLASIKGAGAIFLSSAVVGYIANVIATSIKSNNSLVQNFVSLSYLCADLARKISQVFGALTIGLGILYILSQIIA